MSNRKIVPMTPELEERWRRAKEQTDSELPELLDAGRRMREASEEDTLSGRLRRAIHQCDRELVDIAAAAGVTPVQLTEFLTGDRTLRSDVLDRLASAVSFPTTLSQVPSLGADERR